MKVQSKIFGLLILLLVLVSALPAVQAASIDMGAYWQNNYQPSLSVEQGTTAKAAIKTLSHDQYYLSVLLLTSEGSVVRSIEPGITLPANIIGAMNYYNINTGDLLGNYVLRVKVQNLVTFEPVTKEITLTVTPRTPLFIVTPPGDSLSVNEGNSVTLTVTPSNSNVQVRAVTLPRGATFDGQQLTFSPDYNFVQHPNTLGHADIELTATQGLQTTTYRVSVLVNDVNRNPYFTSVPPTSAHVGEEYTYLPVVVDPDGDNVNIQLDQHPAGMTLRNDLVRWTPTENQLGLTGYIVLLLNDGFGGSGSQSFAINVDSAPILAAIGDKTVIEEETLEFTVSAADPDHDPITITMSSSDLPADANFNSLSGKFHWPTAHGDIGTYHATFTVTDSNGLTDSETITITVTERPQPLFTTNPSDSSFEIDEGEILTINVNSNGEEVHVWREYCILGVCQYFFLDSDETMFADNSFKFFPGYDFVDHPNLREEVKFRFWAMQGLRTETHDVTVVVNDVNRDPVITSSPVTEVQAGTSYVYDVDAADADGDTLTYSLVSNPSNMEINPVPGKISWAPENADLGNHQITVKVDDDYGGEAVQTFTLTVKEGNVEPQNHAPVFDLIPDQAVVEGQTLTFTISATDIDGDDLVFNLVSAAPEGFAFDSNARTATWTPGFDQAGEYDLTFMVSDGQLSDSADVRIVVTDKITPDNHAPIFVRIDNQTINEGETLTFIISATDADADVLVYGAENLPDLALFNRQAFTWTPSYNQAGSYKVTFVVTDGQETVRRTITITVLDADASSSDRGSIYDEARISSVRFAEVPYTPGEYVFINVDVDNNGDSNRGNYRIVASIPELGVRSSTGDFTMSRGSSTTKTLGLLIPFEAWSGEYTVQISFQNDHYRDTAYRLVNVG